MFTLSQVFALVIFVVMFAAIVSDKWHRYIPALVGAALTIIAELYSVVKEVCSSI